MEKSWQKKTATALRYDPKNDAAPKVVASGRGVVAERIIAKAQEFGIPVYDDPELAQVLVGLEIGGEIPPELYQAVAAIIIHVHHLDKKAQEILDKA